MRRLRKQPRDKPPDAPADTDCQPRGHARCDHAFESRKSHGSRVANTPPGGYMDYATSIRSCRFFSREEEAALAMRAKDGDADARRLLIESMLPWVVRRALIAAAKFPHVPLDDLIQNGNLGLIRAVDNFDPTKGRLSTYATLNIVQAMTHAAMEDTLIRVPEVSQRKSERGKAVAAARFRSLMDNEPATAGADEDIPGRDDDLHLVRTAMRQLRCRDRDILLRRMNGETLKEIASVYRLSKERVRQIEFASLEKLRRLCRVSDRRDV